MIPYPTPIADIDAPTNVVCEATGTHDLDHCMILCDCDVTTVLHAHADAVLTAPFRYDVDAWRDSWHMARRSELSAWQNMTDRKKGSPWTAPKS